jgi:metal-dependent HD superfamily phosphatase/phosphodiesterase
MAPKPDDLDLTLSADAALVIDALFASVDDVGPVYLKDAADLHAVWLLTASLDRVLVDTFAPDYESRLAEARARLAQAYGESV